MCYGVQRKFVVQSGQSANNNNTCRMHFVQSTVLCPCVGNGLDWCHGDASLMEYGDTAECRSTEYGEGASGSQREHGIVYYIAQLMNDIVFLSFITLYFK